MSKTPGSQQPEQSAQPAQPAQPEQSAQPEQPAQPAKASTPDSQPSESFRVEFPRSPMSEPPSGLAPSPGLDPSPGIQAPKFEAPPAQEPQATFTPMEPVNFQNEALPTVGTEPLPQAVPLAHAQPFPQTKPLESNPPLPIPSTTTAPPNKTRLSGGAIAGILAGSIALLLLFSTGDSLLSSVFSPTSEEDTIFIDGADGVSDDDFEPDVLDDSAPTPLEVVEDFLFALQDGDADTALDYLTNTYPEEFLTDEVLERSEEIAPISNIFVSPDSTEVSGDVVSVTAEFDIGDRSIVRTFNLVDTSTGPKLTNALIVFSLSGFADSGLTVNGVDPKKPSLIALFPGAYEFEFESDAFAIGSRPGTAGTPKNVVPDSDDSAFIFASDADRSAFFGARLILTEKATRTFRGLIRADLERCLAMSDLSTPCGLGASEGAAGVDDPINITVKRTLTPEGLAVLNALEPVSTGSPSTVFSSNDSMSVDVTVEADQSGKSSVIKSLNTKPLTPYVDFATDSPSLTWR